MHTIYNNIEYRIDDKNCHIVGSFAVRSRDAMSDFCEHALPNHFKEARSVGSYVAEWRAHNLLYDLGLFRSHTEEVDLDIDESKFRRLFYRILSLFYRG